MKYNLEDTARYRTVDDFLLYIIWMILQEKRYIIIYHQNLSLYKNACFEFGFVGNILVIKDGYTLYVSVENVFCMYFVIFDSFKLVRLVLFCNLDVATVWEVWTSRSNFIVFVKPETIILWDVNLVVTVSVDVLGGASILGGILLTKCKVIRVINSLTFEKCSDFKSTITEHILQIKFMSISYESALWGMPQNTFDNKSTLVQVMA